MGPRRRECWSRWARRAHPALAPGLSAGLNLSHSQGYRRRGTHSRTVPWSGWKHGALARCFPGACRIDIVGDIANGRANSAPSTMIRSAAAVSSGRRRAWIANVRKASPEASVRLSDRENCHVIRREPASAPSCNAPRVVPDVSYGGHHRAARCALTGIANDGLETRPPQMTAALPYYQRTVRAPRPFASSRVAARIRSR